MPLEPLRLNFTSGDPSGQDNLEGALAEANGRDIVGRHTQVVFGHAVEPIATPVEFLLQSDHLFTDRPNSGPRSAESCYEPPATGDNCHREGPSQFTGQCIQLTRELNRTVAQHWELLKLRAVVLISLIPQRFTQSSALLADSIPALRIEHLLHPEARRRAVEQAK